MSNIQRAGDKVRQELQSKFSRGPVKYSHIDECVGMRHYSKGRYSLEVVKTVKGIRFKEMVSGGTVRNVDDMIVAAYEARKRVYRKAEAYRQKLEITPAPQLTTPAPRPTTPAVTTLPEVYTRFAIIGLSSAAGFIIGWLIGGAL
jgi:hypothetical protein